MCTVLVAMEHHDLSELECIPTGPSGGNSGFSAVMTEPWAAPDNRETGAEGWAGLSLLCAGSSVCTIAPKTGSTYQK